MDVETILALKSANLAKSQTELEGQQALALIASTSVDNVSLPAVGNTGQNINIKV
ncbi:cytoplasmic protein [Colwellia sp. BRX10-3]|nr:cytoplasmic protein [Colwellia sp. BRX10-3]